MQSYVYEFIEPGFFVLKVFIGAQTSITWSWDQDSFYHWIIPTFLRFQQSRAHGHKEKASLAKKRQEELENQEAQELEAKHVQEDSEPLKWRNSRIDGLDFIPTLTYCEDVKLLSMIFSMSCSHSALSRLAQNAQDSPRLDVPLCIQFWILLGGSVDADNRDNREGEGWFEELQKQREALKALEREREEFLRFLGELASFDHDLDFKWINILNTYIKEMNTNYTAIYTLVYRISCQYMSQPVIVKDVLVSWDGHEELNEMEARQKQKRQEDPDRWSLFGWGWNT